MSLFLPIQHLNRTRKIDDLQTPQCIVNGHQPGAWRTKRKELAIVTGIITYCGSQLKVHPPNTQRGSQMAGFINCTYLLKNMYMENGGYL